MFIAGLLKNDVILKREMRTEGERGWESKEKFTGGFSYRTGDNISMSWRPGLKMD